LSLLYPSTSDSYRTRFRRSRCPEFAATAEPSSQGLAGLHLGVTTVGRILKDDPRPGLGSAAACNGVVTAKRPNHVWHVDLTAVATSMGFWAPWLPFALHQRWPFYWWVAVVIDHYSRCAMGFAIFRNNPTSVSIQSFLENAIVNASAAPKYIICDKGQQFWCDAFKAWCDGQGITPRFGAVGQHGIIAPVKRFILTLTRHSRNQNSLYQLSLSSVARTKDSHHESVRRAPPG